MTRSGATLDSAIRSAQRRLLAIRVGPLVLRAIALASIAAAAAVITIRWLGWSTWWLALAPGLAACAAFALGFRRAPTRVEAAIELDRVHALDDALATTLTAPGARGADETFVALQRAAADAWVSRLDLRRLGRMPGWSLIGGSGTAVAVLAVILAVPWPAQRESPESGRLADAEESSREAEAAAAQVERSAAPESIESLAERIEVLAQRGDLDGTERAVAELEQRLRDRAADPRGGAAETPFETRTERERVAMLEGASRLGDAADAVARGEAVDEPDPADAATPEPRDETGRTAEADPGREKPEPSASPQRDPSAPTDAEKRAEPGVPGGAKEEEARPRPSQTESREAPSKSDRESRPNQDGSVRDRPPTNEPKSARQGEKDERSGEWKGSQTDSGGDPTKTQPGTEGREPRQSQTGVAGPKENQAPKDANAPKEGAAKDANAPGEGQARKDGNAASKGQAPKEGSAPGESKTPKDGPSSTNGDAAKGESNSRDGNAPGKSAQGAPDAERGAAETSEPRAGKRPGDDASKDPSGSGSTESRAPDASSDGAGSRAPRAEKDSREPAGRRATQGADSGDSAETEAGGEPDEGARREALRERIEELSRRLGDSATRQPRPDEPDRRNGSGRAPDAARPDPDAEPGAGDDSSARASASDALPKRAGAAPGLAPRSSVPTRERAATYDVEALRPDPDRPGRVLEGERERDSDAPISHARRSAAGAVGTAGLRGTAGDPSIAPRFRPLLERYYDRLRPAPARSTPPSTGTTGAPGTGSGS